MSPTSLGSLFFDRVHRDGGRVALLTWDGDRWSEETWDDLARAVGELAVALRRRGVRPGDRVVQLSENRREWILADLAILHCGAIHVPIHATLAGPQIVEQVVDCGARLAIVSGAEQQAKLAELPRLAPQVEVVSHGELTAEPVDSLATAETVLELEAVHATADDVATIIYTSGTTGEPKGVMLTHGNLISNTLGTIEVFPCGPDDVRLTMLPLSHIFARTCDLYAWIAMGHVLALARSRESVLEDCKIIRPTLINSVPYFFDRVMRMLREQGRDAVPGALREEFGGRMRLCCSGGAALPNHVAEYYLSQGVFLAQGFGLTETSPVLTLSTPEQNRVGWVGRPIRDAEVRIAADGEVLTRGPQVMRGYWNKPQATAAVLVDGWFQTGDLGEIDRDGYLRITGRKKELIVTTAGKNIAPVYLESLLGEDPLIHQALVLGDGRSYLAALIVPSGDALRREIAQAGLAVTSAEEALTHPQVRTWYAERIAARLTGVSHHEQIRKFTLLPRPFTLEAGELTPTLKLRREIIATHYAKEIAGMYA